MAIVLLAGACGGSGGGAAGDAVVGTDGTPVVTQPGNGGAAAPAGTEYAPGTNIPLPLEAVEITWMHNGDTDPLRAYWNQVAQDFMAQNPGVVVNVTAVESDHLRYSVLPSAFQAADEPDLFQSWGGGELVSWINQGVVMDLTQVLAPTIANVGSVEAIWELDGHAFGVPYAVGPAGFWVNLNLLDQAGLVQNPEHDAAGNVTGGTVDWPTDFDGLFAMWTTLKDHGITPVALGGGSGWAAAWWYYAMVAKACPSSAITAAGNLHDFSDPCWEQAATDLQEVLNQNAFNTGWETTLAQGSADSSAGMVVMGDAAMEFMGPWNGTTMTSIYQSAGGGAGATPDFITWYPLPNFPGGQGAGNIMVGGDGFSVLNPNRGSEARSNAAAALLAFIVSDAVQSEGVAFPMGGNTVWALPGNPVNPAVIAGLTDPITVRQAAAVSAASFSMQWLDTYLGQAIGTPLNDAVNAFMRGHGTPSSLLQTINTAAGNY